MLIYVDDILVIGSSKHAIQSFITTLNQTFSLKNLGVLHYFLVLEATRSSDGALQLTQTKYINQILHKAQMVEAKPQHTPMISSLRLTVDGSTAFTDRTLYRQIVVPSIPHLHKTRYCILS